MDLGISGRNAAVAAASTGLGYGCAQALLAEGCNVAICSRSQERVDAAVKALEGSAGSTAKVVGIVADVSSADDARRFVEEAASALGSLDILVANAGGPPPGQPSETSIEAYRQALDLNLLSTIAMAQAAVAGMREGQWGRIVAITSIGARQPIGYLAASSVARAGVTSFVKTLATEVAADGVTVNSAQPGLHATDRVKSLGSADRMAETVPAKQLGTAEDFGKAVAFLCSEPAKFITGTALLLDGGQYGGLI